LEKFSPNTKGKEKSIQVYTRKKTKTNPKILCRKMAKFGQLFLKKKMLASFP
jgi:hypothetical protein